MNISQQLQKLNDRLDKYKNKLASAEQRNDRQMMAQFKHELDKANKKIASLKSQQRRQVGSEGGSIKTMAFNRVLTKAEQADMGKLKKSVRGLVVVHPLTALGREMGVEAVTGFSPVEF
jgi:ribosome-associated protein